MATTYFLIASTTLGSNQQTVSFTSIPQTYTDLIVKVNARGGSGGTIQNIYYTINGITTGNTYSSTYGYMYGTSTRQFAASNDANYGYLGFASAAGALSALSFGGTEIYIPNYSGSTYRKTNIVKSIGADSQSSGSWLSMITNTSSTTAAITSLQLRADSTGAEVWVTNSKFDLYGVTHY